MLQYIVGGSNAHEMIETAQQALENGCRWLRLDFSLLPQSEIEPVVKDLQERCNSLEAFLSLEDDVDNAAATKVSGVHLNVGSPADVIDARKRLGEEPFLGITVSSAADVPFIPRSAIDYIALQPCHSTLPPYVNRHQRHRRAPQHYPTSQSKRTPQGAKHTGGATP